MKEQMSIGAVSRLLGLSPEQVRGMEQAGTIPTATRVNGRRYWDAVVVQHIHEQLSHEKYLRGQAEREETQAFCRRLLAERAQRMARCQSTDTGT